MKASMPPTAKGSDGFGHTIGFHFFVQIWEHGSITSRRHVSTVSVFRGCRDKSPPTGWLKTTGMCSLLVLGPEP